LKLLEIICAPVFNPDPEVRSSKRKHNAALTTLPDIIARSGFVPAVHIATPVFKY
jgi:hypothetical protein